MCSIYRIGIFIQINRRFCPIKKGLENEDFLRFQEKKKIKRKNCERKKFKRTEGSTKLLLFKKHIFRKNKNFLKIKKVFKNKKQ